MGKNEIMISTWIPVKSQETKKCRIIIVLETGNIVLSIMIIVEAQKFVPSIMIFVETRKVVPNTTDLKLSLVEAQIVVPYIVDWKSILA